jgi:hypothetical protein
VYKRQQQTHWKPLHKSKAVITSVAKQPIFA